MQMEGLDRVWDGNEMGMHLIGSLIPTLDDVKNLKGIGSEEDKHEA